jgi:hypothetical protein
MLIVNAKRSIYFLLPCAIVYVVLNEFPFYERGIPHFIMVFLIFWPSFLLSLFFGILTVMLLINKEERKNYKYAILALPVLAAFAYFLLTFIIAMK